RARSRKARSGTSRSGYPPTSPSFHRARATASEVAIKTAGAAEAFERVGRPLVTCWLHPNRLTRGGCARLLILGILLPGVCPGKCFHPSRWVGGRGGASNSRPHSCGGGPRRCLKACLMALTVQ